MTPLERALSHIDTQRLDKLLIDAVSVYSPTWAEAPAVDVFVRFLDTHGVPYTLQPVTAKDSPNRRENILIQIGPQPNRILWLGHTDTVVLPDDELLEPSVEDGTLYGLGSADMKSGCAAAVEAATAIVKAGIELRGGLSIALVVGEEEYGDGCEAIPDSALAPVAVVGEPTNLTPCTEHFGYLETELKARGSRAHAAIPEHGANAIHAMLGWLTSVLETRRTGEDPVIYNPRGIKGASPLFAVPEKCKATLDAHVPADTPIRQVRDTIDRARELALATHGGCKLSWKEEFWAPGYRLDNDDPDLAAVRRSFRQVGRTFRTSRFRSHSDAAALAARVHGGAEAVEDID